MQPLQNTPGSSFGRYALLGFGLLWSAISCCVLAPIVASSLPGLSRLETPASLVTVASGLAFPLLFGGCFLGIGVVVTLFGLGPIIAATRVNKPALQISSTSLRSGQEFTLTYQQGFKSNVEAKRLAVRLILRESATYRRGTNSVTVTHDHLIQNFELPERQFQAGETFNQTFHWAIPRGAMHSFEASRNRLRWLVDVSVEMKGWPTYEEMFALTVLPELA
jgi:hypothetical protein